MAYVDGFVAAVPNAKKEAFRRFSAAMNPLFLEYGALQVVDCWGDDVPDGEVTSFGKAVQAGDDETVVFSWIVWPSKEARDAIKDTMMADPRFMDPDNPMPFDGKRLIYGCFEPIVVLGAPLPAG